MKILNRIFRRYYDIGPLLIRLMVGFHLIHTVTGVIFNSGMENVADFFKNEHIIVPDFFAPVVAYAEFFGGILYIMGLFTRPTALVLSVIFISAISIVHLSDSYTNTFPAIVMLTGSLYLLFCGPGKISIDHMMVKQDQTG